MSYWLPTRYRVLDTRGRDTGFIFQGRQETPSSLWSRRTMPRRLALSLVCPLAMTLPAWAGVDGPPTYHKDVEPIVLKHCQECHRPGQVAPFALMDYAQARKRASDLVAVTSDRRMPPWHASTTTGGPFRDVRAMS